MITREQFMEFFRDGEFHNNITPDDAAEIFCGVLHGSSDITEELINELFTNYSVDGEIKIILPKTN
jgi:hypothetical protein